MDLRGGVGWRGCGCEGAVWFPIPWRVGLLEGGKWAEGWVFVLLGVEMYMASV